MNDEISLVMLVCTVCRGIFFVEEKKRQGEKIRPRFCCWCGTLMRDWLESGEEKVV